MNQQNINFTYAEPLSAPVPWTSIGYMTIDASRMAQNRIVTYGRSDRAHLAFDMLRTKVLASSRANGWRSLGITSPTVGCGKSTVALNLAISLARQSETRVGLLDLDLRRPRLAAMLGHAPEFTMQDFLTGQCRVDEYFVRIGENLAVGASPQPVNHPAELLHNKRTARVLKRLAIATDIAIYNLPPMLPSDDLFGFLPQMDAAILVVGAEFSTFDEIDVCEQTLREQSKLLGVVLNKCHYTERYENASS